ncbi:hypothetical protein [Lentibacillus salicampi]|uniref:Uncharacterized protein n=1 Tax=Lentibacillus salicampi TaxID=175306 RepID=A0A4Y9A8L3_9BACI|nr:hypothetical protein [Lentibacillus salicampi]TFJ92123.1 hypothetical protein E4U82_14170 [Lentibacillus salicampi]
MNEKEFANFLRSISNYDQQDDVLQEAMRFIKKFYIDFKEEVETNFEDHLDEFKVNYNQNVDLITVKVQNNRLTFTSNFKDNVIVVKYQQTNQDELYIKNNQVYSKKSESVINDDLFYGYLDSFKKILTN